MLGILFNPGESAKTDKELNYKFTDANGVYNGVKVYDQANIYVIEEADSRKFDLSEIIYTQFPAMKSLHLTEI